MQKIFNEEVSEFIYNRIGKRLMGDNKGEDLREIFFQLLEEYKKYDSQLNSKEFVDLYDTFVELISYHERRSYKLGFCDGINLFFVLDEDNH